MHLRIIDEIWNTMVLDVLLLERVERKRNISIYAKNGFKNV